MHSGQSYKDDIAVKLDCAMVFLEGGKELQKKIWKAARPVRLDSLDHNSKLHTTPLKLQ